MRPAGRRAAAIAAALTASVCLGDPPKDLGLVEREQRTLVQLTVRIHPATPADRERAARLTKDDFFVFFDGKEIPKERFELDNFCPMAPAEAAPATAEAPKHLLFFVDQLSPEGQDNTKAMLARMIPSMAAEGFEMKVLPNVETGWTRDVDRLLHQASGAIDPWSATSEHEHAARDNLRTLLTSNQVEQAIAVAREAEREAQISFEGPVLQLARAISEMDGLPSPKALIYFAELGTSFREMIVDSAIRSGVAVYAVKADGMPPADPTRSTAKDPGAIITTSLFALSDHTGGRFAFGGFRKGTADRIVERVRADLSCLYVLSLDAAGLDRDKTLHPKVTLKPDLKARLEVRTIPELTVQSENRRQAQALAVALRSGSWPGMQQAGVTLVPERVDGADVEALVQLTIDADAKDAAIPTAWDLGVNYFGAARVSGYGGARVTTRAAKIVFEKRVKLPAGPYSIVGVAQEAGGPGLARGTVAGVLVRPAKTAVAFLHPPEVLQWEPGAFVAEGTVPRKAGWTPVRFGMAASDRATSLLTPVCRGANVRGALTIEKTVLLPEDEIRLPATDWRDAKDVCRLVRDDVAGDGGLPWAGRPYEATLIVRVTDASGKAVAKAATAFWVIGPGATLEPRASAP